MNMKMKMNKHYQPCPCGSGALYINCCRRYHQGVLPRDAAALMRSRYSAYALNLPQYIIQTTHPKNPICKQDQDCWLHEIEEFIHSTEFNKLEIVNCIHGKDVAFVTFVAHLNQKGQNASFMEKSRFEKLDHKWLYHSIAAF